MRPPVAAPLQGHQVVDPHRLICVGHLGWDITSLAGTTRRTYGGAALHFCAAATVLGCKLELVSYVNYETCGDLLAFLRSLDVDTTSVSDSERSARFEMFRNESGEEDSEQFHMSFPDPEPDLAAALAKLNPKGRLVHLCPAVPDREAKQLDAAKGAAELSIQLSTVPLLHDLPFYQARVEEADYVFMNEDEARILTEEVDSDRALSALASMSSTCFYVTSSRGAHAIAGEQHWHCRSLALPQIHDPTGAGDAFAGGCTAARLLSSRQDVALRVGTLCAAASLSGRSSEALLRILGLDVET